MTVKLNRRAVSHARELIAKGRTVKDQRDAWSEDAPSADAENDFIEKHGIEAFGDWHLGIDSDASEGTKGRYSFPFGDFSRLHRCAVISLESRAAQNDHDDIARAAKRLLEEIDT